MYFLFVFCLLSFNFQLSLYKCEGAIVLNYNLIKNNYFIQLSADNLLNERYTLIDLQNPYSFFIYKGINFKESNEQVYSNQLSKNVKAISSSTEFTIKTDIKKYKFNLYYYNILNVPEYFKEGIGFGKNYTKETYSFINVLKMNNIINKLTMMFSPEQKDKGKIFIGDYDSEVAVAKNYQKNSFSCSSGEKWGCLVSKIEIGNLTVLSEPTYFLFSTTHTGMIVPNEMMLYLNQTYFAKYIQSKDCYLHWGTTEKYFSCYCSAVYNFPDIYFYINGYKVKFNPKYYFYNFIDTCYLNFIGEIGNDNTFVLGAIFLQSFYFELNYEKSEVKFYSDMPVIKENSIPYKQISKLNSERDKDNKNGLIFGFDKKNIYAVSIFVNVVIMLFGIVYLIALKHDKEL